MAKEHTLWSILLEQQLRRRVRLCHRLIARVRKLRAEAEKLRQCPECECVYDKKESP